MRYHYGKSVQENSLGKLLSLEWLITLPFVQLTQSTGLDRGEVCITGTLIERSLLL